MPLGVLSEHPGTIVFPPNAGINGLAVLDIGTARSTELITIKEQENSFARQLSDFKPFKRVMLFPDTLQQLWTR